MGYDNVQEVRCGSVTGELILFSKFMDGIFEVRLHEEYGMLVSFSDWHQALAHVSADTLNCSSSMYTDGHLIPRKPNNFHCQDCSLSKSTHSRSKNPHTSATKPFELIHSDLSGKFSVQSLGKAFYYMTFIDDYTRYTWVYILKTKDQASQAIKDFLAMVKRQFNTEVKYFRTDGGGEYVNYEVKATFAQEWITHEVTPPYSPESNGVVERFNRTLKEMIRTWLRSIEKYFLLAEAVNSMVYIKNKLPHRMLDKTTPFEKLFGQKPSITHLQPFGRKCYVHIPEAKRPSGT